MMTEDKEIFNSKKGRVQSLFAGSQNKSQKAKGGLRHEI